MMQPIMQIGLTVFMARTMNGKKPQIKREKGAAPMRRPEAEVTLEKTSPVNYFLNAPWQALQVWLMARIAAT